MSDQTTDSTEARITGVVRRLLAEDSRDRDLQRRDDLRDAGLDSMRMVHLVLAVESEFGIEIPEASITPANFRTIASIADVVGRLLGSAGGDRAPR
jgi:acyl carrier protein